MKILFYVLAIAAAIFGLISLGRVIVTAVGGEGLDPVQLLLGIVSLFLASIWVMRARSSK